MTATSPAPRPLSSSEQMVHTYVRNRDSVSASDRATLFAPENITQTRTVLTGLKRDVEAQFIAMKARLNEFRTVCDLAIDDDKGVWVPALIDGRGHELEPGTSYAPDTAYLVMCGRENRWKVRNVRFLALIERALEEVNDQLRVNVYAMVRDLLNAVEHHQSDQSPTRDQTLYQAAEAVKMAL